MSKVRIGFIGSGGIARHHMSQIAAIPELEIAALSDPSETQIEQCHQRFPNLKEAPVYNDWKTMLDKEKLDAVHIDSPHTPHAEQIIAAFDKGLHVLCEKPLVTSVKDAHKVIEARDKAKKIGLLSYQRHSQAEFRYIKKKIDRRVFGEVTFISALQCQEWKKATAGSWRQDPALSGGGQLNDSGSHLIDIILWVTGLKADSVTAFCDSCGTPVDINSTVNVRFDGGAMATLSVIGDAPGWHEDITIVCEKGAFFMRNGTLTVQDDEGARFEAQGLRGGSNPDANFAGAIVRGDEVLSPFECGLRVIELTEAAWRSAEKGGAPVKVD